MARSKRLHKPYPRTLLAQEKYSKVTLPPQSFDRKTIRKQTGSPAKIDTEKAFNSVWIGGLIKIEREGSGWKTTCHLAHFYKKQNCALTYCYILIDTHDTSEFKIETELPPGSLLSPVLFILFIDDFFKDWNLHFKFANDSSVLIDAKATENLNAQLNDACRDIESWCSKWRMAVNSSNTANGF